MAGTAAGRAPGADLRPSVPTCLGLALAQVEMYALNQQVIGMSVGAVLAFYLAFIAALALTAAAGALRAGGMGAGGATSASATRPWGPRPATAAAGALVALALLGGLASAGPLALAACALGGVGEALLFQRMFGQCCRLPLRGGARCALASFAVAALAGLAVEALGLALPLARTAVLVALALAAPLAACDAMAAPESPAAATAPLDRRQLVLQAAELVLFSLVLGFLRGEGAEAWGSPAVTLGSLLLRAAVAAGLLWLLGSNLSQARLSAVSQVVLICVAVAFIALALAGESVPWAMPALVSLARNVVLILLTVTLLYVVRASGWHPMLAYGAGRGVHAAGTLVGIVLNLRAGELPGFVGVSANAVLFIVACAFLAFAVTSMRTARIFGQAAGQGADDPAGASASRGAEEEVDARCAELAGRFALTARELEVVRLIAKGRSRGYIASHLGISENTVRFHARHAYAKLQIHSKQELLTLLGAE